MTNIWIFATASTAQLRIAEFVTVAETEPTTITTMDISGSNKMTALPHTPQQAADKHAQTMLRRAQIRAEALSRQAT
jgi:hypothetical protein